MIVDAQGASVRESLDAVSGQMDFADGLGRQGGDIGRGIPAVVVSADANVVDVAKDAAAGTGRDSSHELPFRNDRAAEGDVGRRVFDEDAPPQIGLGLVDMAADNLERFFRHRQRKQIGQVGSADKIPGDMFGHQAGFNPLGNLSDALKMCRITPFGAPKREPYPMQRYRRVAPDSVEIA